MRELLLASTSRYRQELLRRLQIPFRAVDPGTAEAGVPAAGIAPQELARLRARAKARAVAERHPQALVLGSDQVCALGGSILGKPGDPERQRQQLERLAGRTHELFTAVVLLGPGIELEGLAVAVLHARTLSPAEIERYVAAEPASDCAGGYKIEGLGVALFERVETDDATGIVGLPLALTARLLRQAGCACP